MPSNLVRIVSSLLRQSKSLDWTQRNASSRHRHTPCGWMYRLNHYGVRAKKKKRRVASICCDDNVNRRQGYCTLS
eukprot:scaffold14203_cov170-Amphora_coffeaeformis.AAC.5